MAKEDSRGGERPRKVEMMLVKHNAKLSRPMAGWRGYAGGP